MRNWWAKQIHPGRRNFHDTCIFLKPPSPFLFCNILHKNKSPTFIKMEFAAKYQCKEFQLQGIYKYKEETFHSALNSHIWLWGGLTNMVEFKFWYILAQQNRCRRINRKQRRSKQEVHQSQAIFFVFAWGENFFFFFLLHMVRKDCR